MVRLLRDTMWIVAVLAAGFAAAGPARAQSTDGYHAMQVFPVVVDTASFTQRFTFRNPWNGPFVADVAFYPEATTAQAALGSPVACTPLQIPANGVQVVASLRALCPGLAPGSAFGMLVLRAPVAAGFAGFSRVSNPAGNGFSVEAFAAHHFTSGRAVVTGLRRSAATMGAPAFQSNCFVGNLGKVSPSANLSDVPVDVSLRDTAGVLLSQATVTVAPGAVLRLLDVFGVTGAPAGDHLDTTASFTTRDDPLARDGIVAFCTVQDNTSFGADFRIAKQEMQYSSAYVGPRSDLADRYSFDSHNPATAGDPWPQFTIAPGATRDVHVLYLRHPDRVSCAILAGTIAGGSGTPASASYGLEARLLAADDTGEFNHVLAGGNNTSYWSDLYLGDKADQGFGGDTRYLIEVESNGFDDTHARPYTVHCRSGSGHTRADRIATGLPTRF